MKEGSCLTCIGFGHSSTLKDAAKCKWLIKQARDRIAKLEARTKAVITFSREDIAQLLQLGLYERIHHRVEQLHVDQQRLSAYAQIDDLCAAMLADFSLIGKERDLPVGIRVAMSTLTFAAARYGELLELSKMKNLFRQWWGKEFVSINENLLPGNLVSPHMRQILTIDPILDESSKVEMINEIAQDHSLVTGDLQSSKLQEEKLRGTPDSPNPYGRGDTPDSDSPYLHKDMLAKMEIYSRDSSEDSSD